MTNANNRKLMSMNSHKESLKFQFESSDTYGTYVCYLHDCGAKGECTYVCKCV